MAPTDDPRKEFGDIWHPREKLHAYWRNPDEGNAPETYVEGAERSHKLLQAIQLCVPPGDEPILEIGCNVGRNLAFLYEAGYRNLEGIEINSSAVEMMKNTFPDMAAASTIHTGAVEDVIPDLPDDTYRLVYTMAVLEHIHPDSDWIFPHIVRITSQYIITFEEEFGVAGHVIPRDYEQVFTKFGTRQLDFIWCKDIEGLGENYVARIFSK